MTFLNPFILFGLAAAAIPIVLHLFNLRRLKTIEFSTLSFLKELQKTKIRRLKIRQILLLALRTLLVIFLVLAFSRPTLRGSMIGSLGTHAKTTAVLIIDDSFSMTGMDEQGELLKQAKQSALGIVDLLKDGDEVYLVKLSEVSGKPSSEETSASRDFSFMRNAINNIKPSATHRTIEDAMRYSAKLLARSSNYNKELYLFSDFQSGVVQTETASSKENLFSAETRFFFIPIGSREPQNFGIESVTLPNTIFEPGKPFTVKARIGNYSTEDAKNHSVSVFLNGTRVAQRSVDIQRGTTADVEFSVSSSTPGFAEGFVELEDDELEFDNRRYFTAHIPDRIRTVIAGNSTDLRYIKIALGARQSSGGSALEVQEIGTDKLGSSQINAADVILIANPQELSSAQASQLSSFVNNGGGLIVFPGATTQQNSFNQFASSARLPPITGIDVSATPKAKEGNASFIEFDRVELRHPIFQGMFEEPQLAPSSRLTGAKSSQKPIESPHITTSVRYVGTPHSTSVITLSNGSPFLIDQQLGEGRALMFSVVPNLEWSDFPLKGIFVPLLHRSISYLAQEKGQQREVFAGDKILLKNLGHTGERLSIESPAKVEVLTTNLVRGAGIAVQFSETELAGIYNAKAGNDIVQKFAVNIHPAESHTRKASDSEINTMLKQLGIPQSSLTSVKGHQEMQRVVLQSRFGVELWKPFLIAALILALFEMIVARVGKKELSTQ